MAKRFTSTEIWEEDWFLEMPNEYKLFWYYMLSNCDHAGIYKVNLRSFRGLLEVKVSSATALTLFNYGKQRIRLINEGLWFIEEFFMYQYGTTFNFNNRLHESIFTILEKHKIELSSIRGLKVLKDRVKDKDKDKYINTPLKEFMLDEKKEDMVVLKMMDVWKKYKPTYPVEKEVDYPACLQFAYKIADVKGFRHIDVVGSKENEIINSFGKIVAFVVSDNFLKTMALKNLVNQFQMIYQKMQEAAPKEATTQIKKKTQKEIDREAEEWANS